MVNKKNWLGILVMALIFGMTVVGCDLFENNDDGGGGGGSGTGSISLTNKTGIDLRKLKITNGGKQVKYDEVVSRNANYPGVPTGLCTMSFNLGLNGKVYSKDFTVGNGEKVSITFTENLNFTVSRSGGSGSGEGGGTTTDTGSIKIANSSGYALTSGSISHGGSTVKSFGEIAKGGSVTYSGIPVGSCVVKVNSKRGGGIYGLYFWEKTVTVTKGGTTTVTVTSTGWK